MGRALEAIRRLEKWERERTRETPAPPSGADAAPSAPPAASHEAARTREDFLSRVRETTDRISALYPAGLLESLTEEENGLLDGAEESMDAGFQAGDFVAAELGLEEWERAWVETIRRRRGGRP